MFSKRAYVLQSVTLVCWDHSAPMNAAEDTQLRFPACLPKLLLYFPQDLGEGLSLLFFKYIDKIFNQDFS